MTFLQAAVFICFLDLIGCYLLFFVYWTHFFIAVECGPEQKMDSLSLNIETCKLLQVVCLQ